MASSSTTCILYTQRQMNGERWRKSERERARALDTQPKQEMDMVMKQQRQRRHSFFIPSFANIIFACYLLFLFECCRWCHCRHRRRAHTGVLLLRRLLRRCCCCCWWCSSCVLFKHSLLMPKVILYCGSLFPSLNSTFLIRSVQSFSQCCNYTCARSVWNRVERTLLMDNCFVN